MTKELFIKSCTSYLNTTGGVSAMSNSKRFSFYKVLAGLFDRLQIEPEFIFALPEDYIGMLYYVMKLDQGKHVTKPRAPDGSLYN